MKKNKPNRQGGQAIITSVMFFLLITSSIAASVATPVTRRIQVARDYIHSKESFFASESSNEDVVYRIKVGKQYGTTETLSIGTLRATTTVLAVPSGLQVTTSGESDKRIRKAQTDISQGSGSTFSYGVQTGRGGFILENNAQVTGSIYANGPVTGGQSNIIRGDVISGGASGLVRGNSTSDRLQITNNGSAFAHTIQNASIAKDAYYQSISGSVVGGVSHPGSADPAESTLPLSDAYIAQLETDAATGGTITSPCPYRITGTVTIGPKKINCDLEIEGNAQVTVAGNLWVNGNIEIGGNAILRISSALGKKSVAIIADATNDTTNSRISLENNTQFINSGTAGSYFLLISMNNSAENGGDIVAIDAKNNALGDFLAYASHGEVMIQNNLQLKEVTAYRIRAKNNSIVSYQTGLANITLSSNPSGGYQILDMREPQ